MKNLEERPKAVPVICAGKLKFPPKESSRITLEKVIGFCQARSLGQAFPSSSRKDIRFLAYKQDQALGTAFGQEIVIPEQAPSETHFFERVRTKHTSKASRSSEYCSFGRRPVPRDN